MNNIRCYDIDGNIIDTFYQWDKNQKIIVPIDSFNYDANIIAPKIHFTNDKMSNALPVQSVIEEGNIIADVPNILLETNLPINIFFHFSSHKNLSSQRTIASTIIPVRKKNKPDNYEYEENLTEYTFEDLVQGMLDTNNKLDFASTEEMKNFLGIKG